MTNDKSNPKSEIRMTIEIRNPKVTSDRRLVRFSGFELLSDFVIVQSFLNVF